MLKQLLTGISLLAMSSMANAYSSDDEQIDEVLAIVSSGSQQRKEQVMERLQWSTLSDARLYDVFEQDLLASYEELSFEKDKIRTLAYKLRALGYSGNEKYISTLDLIIKQSKNNKLKRYARKAKADFPNFLAVQNSLMNVSYTNAELPSEVVNYIRLLKTNNSFAQRQAAKAAFHEYQKHPELLEEMAKLLRNTFLKEDLDKQSQDMAAWLCKALIRAGGYDDLMKQVSEKTPYNKIKKYAKYND